MAYVRWLPCTERFYYRLTNENVGYISLGEQSLSHTGERAQPLRWQELEADGGQTIEAAADGREGPAEHAGHEEAREAGDVCEGKET